MQKIMAIMSEGLPQKLKCIKMGLEERPVFKLSLHSHLLLSFDGYPFTITTLQP